MSHLPPDNPDRKLVVIRGDQQLTHLGVAGNTYTTLLAGKDTGDRYCLIEMYVLPNGGPPPHRHDFEESFTVLEGEIEATFRGETLTAKAGDVIAIPANAPHRFLNKTAKPARLLCICSPAGQEDYFAEIGVPVATRTTPPPPLDPESQARLKAKVEALGPKYRTEMLEHA
ncbi:MAG: cupin domain-containing protein [Bryobacteraceae bacterium]